MDGLHKIGRVVCVTLVLVCALALPARATRTQPQPAPSISSSPPQFTGCDEVWDVPSGSPSIEQDLVDLVNQIRTDKTLPPLKRVELLNQSARYHATDLGHDNYLHHDTHDRLGDSLNSQCTASERIALYYGESIALAENIAAGNTTPESVLQDWMEHPMSGDHILSDDLWEIGVGYALPDVPGGPYWVQDMGRRAGIYPIVINQEAASSPVRDVSLYIYGEGTWDEIRLRNDDGDWSDWQPFQSAMDWVLSAGNGLKTVWVEMRNSAETTLSSDEIYLGSGVILGNLPETITFEYGLEPLRREITPLNVGSYAPMTWSLTSAGDWFLASPSVGTTPASFWISCTIVAAGTTATHTGNVTVTVVDPSDATENPQRIDLTLRIPQSLDEQLLYLPLVLRS
ncbi:MAG: CAP domain-containing protein [Chloroflexi bacterium]|nr:CAP domain-containing protein [Chloroflexota bacterium]